MTAATLASYIGSAIGRGEARQISANSCEQWRSPLMFGGRTEESSLHTTAGASTDSRPHQNKGSDGSGPPCRCTSITSVRDFACVNGLLECFRAVGFVAYE